MERTPPNWLSWFIIAQCLIALGDLPYGYYQILRLTVSAYTGYMAWLYLREPRNNWTWAFSAALLINNPILPIVLSKEIHAIFNITTAAIVFFEYYPRGSKADLKVMKARWAKAKHLDENLTVSSNGERPANELTDFAIAATKKVIALSTSALLVVLVLFGIEKYKEGLEHQEAAQTESARSHARSKLEMAEAIALSKVTAKVDRSGFKCLSKERLPWQGKGLTIEILNGSDRTAVLTKFTISTFEKGHSQPAEPVSGSTDLIIEPGKTVKACVASGAWNPIDEAGADLGKYNFTVAIHEVIWAS